MGINDRDYMRHGYVPRRSRHKKSSGRSFPTPAHLWIGLGIALVGLLSVLFYKSERDAQGERDAQVESNSSKVVFPIDVNTCEPDHLIAVPHIGPALRDRIISNRPYRDVRELLRVPGIGETTLKRIADYVMVSPTVIDVTRDGPKQTQE